MKNKKLFDVICIGDSAEVRKVGIQLGRSYASWDEVPKKQLDFVKMVNDCTLFAKRDKVISDTKDMTTTEILRYVRNNTSRPVLPNLGKTGGWIWWPSDDKKLVFPFRYSYYNLPTWP